MLSVSELTTWVQYVLMVIASFLEGDVTTLKKKKKSNWTSAHSSTTQTEEWICNNPLSIACELWL